MIVARATLSLVLFGLLTACVSDRPKQEPWDKSQRVDVQVDLAWNYLQRDELAVALTHARKALELNGRDSRANHVMALLQLRFGNQSAARSYFQDAVRADSNNNDARNDFGAFMCEVGDYRGGIEQLEVALASPLNRRIAISHLYAGNCYRRQAQLNEASHYYRQALSINPSMPAALLAMAGISYAEQNFLSARAYLQRYFEVGPETPDSLLLGVKVENRLGGNDLATEYARRLRQGFPRSKEAEDASALVPAVAQ